MTAPAEARTPLIEARRRRAAVIAHAAGNSLRLTRKATEDGADFVEIDLFVRGGRFEARHERSLYPIPLWFEKWYMRVAPRKPIGVSEVLAELGETASLFLDLKNGGRRAGQLLRRVVDESGPDVRFAVSSQSWGTLRAVKTLVPEVELYYSIDVQAKLDLFRSVIERDINPQGVSCRHSLLSRRIVEALHDHNLSVVAWTVDDVDRAAELLSWGIDGITTHKVEEIRELVSR